MRILKTKQGSPTSLKSLSKHVLLKSSYKIFRHSRSDYNIVCLFKKSNVSLEAFPLFKQALVLNILQSQHVK